MWCQKCNRDLGQCICPDLYDRLKAIGASGQVILTFCSGCGAYASRCTCPHPKPAREQRLGERIVGHIQSRYARLEKWAVVMGDNPYQPPEVQEVRLHGNIYEDDRFQDGAIITTSPIEFVDIEAKMVRTKSQTWYKLGAVDPEWDKVYPAAEARFFANAKKWQDGADGQRGGKP